MSAPAPQALVERAAELEPAKNEIRALAAGTDLGALSGALELAMEAHEVDGVIHEQEAADPMPLKSLVEDVYAEVPLHLRRQYNRFHDVAERLGQARPGDGAFPL